ncbi:MAG: divalent-cation tolerance protein CutA [Candidatus Omnitrophica bacterium]|nr:divalent-cation tolerance protein CutA [Candidatus Omnitrophota bacterium]
MVEIDQGIVVFITASTDEEAKGIADKLLDQKKAACVNIIPKIDSHFWWQGKKEKSREVLLIVKSRGSLLDDIISLVKEAHSYEVPEIIAIPIVGGNQGYLNWIKEVTG